MIFRRIFAILALSFSAIEAFSEVMAPVFSSLKTCFTSPLSIVSCIDDFSSERLPGCLPIFSAKNSLTLARALLPLSSN